MMMEPYGDTFQTAPSIDVSGMIDAAQPIAKAASTIYLRHTEPWFIGLLAHGSAVKGGFIPNCSDIDFQLYLEDGAFDAPGYIKFDIAQSIHLELAEIDPTPFRYIQCYSMTRNLRTDFVGPIPGAYHVIYGRCPVPAATADELRQSAQDGLKQLNAYAPNLLSHGGGRLERHVRLLCTKVWPVLYQVLVLQQDDPIATWNLPKEQAMALLPESSEMAYAIQCFYQAVLLYYPYEASVDRGLSVIESGLQFLKKVNIWSENRLSSL
ncbi:MAG: hypothetical protein AAF702_37790 [Chloroflexota bacterium]